MSRLAQWIGNDGTVDMFLQWPTAGVMAILACGAFYASRKVMENPLGQGLAMASNIVGFIFLAPMAFWGMALLDIFVFRPS